MTKSPHLSQEAITDLVKAYETIHGVSLCMEDYRFLLFAVSEFVEKAIDKFVAGAGQHNADGQNPFLSIDHQTESEKEIFDLWFYNQGRKIKERKCKQVLPT